MLDLTQTIKDNFAGKVIKKVEGSEDESGDVLIITFTDDTTVSIGSQSSAGHGLITLK